MRAGTSWSDVRIMNMSARGLMISGQHLPTRGAYVEVRKGRQSIVARVVWCDNASMGVHTQDKVPIQDLIEEPHHGSEPRLNEAQERRGTPRTPERSTKLAEASRAQGRGFEFAVMLLLAAAGAWIVFDTVQTALRAPFMSVEQALASRSPR